MAPSTAPQEFDAFYEESKDAVLRAVLLATREPDRTEDAVAEAYAAAFARWDRLSSHANPTAWVIRTAMNRFRSGWRVWRRERPEMPEIQSLAPPASGFDADLLDALWRLPIRQRQVVALRVLADLDTNHTARVLGIAPNTVGVHLHRALQSLRVALAANGYEEIAQ